MASLKGSSLVEVLIAMVILLTVFAVGMLIFANLTSSSPNSTRKTIAQQMQQLQADWTVEESFDALTTITVDSVEYQIQEEEVVGFADLRKVTIYARPIYADNIIDSLAAYHLFKQQ